MGALHAGHMTLVRKAREDCGYVVVSLFVNPIQFGPNEDFGKYPRPFEADLKACTNAGVDAIFHPGIELMYPAGQDNTTKVVPPAALISGLCGAFRPGHFEGVATVVAKLFNLIQPEFAYFGQKDYQQLQVIKKMVADLDMSVNVVPVPIVRESDGLALSSRNVYLTPEQRKLAPVLYSTLKEVSEHAKQGTGLSAALKIGKEKISALPGVTLQYLEACDPTTLVPLHQARVPMVILVAAKYGDVRLIDNLIVVD
jgi:pantoate ligase/cytidylate kinase